MKKIALLVMTIMIALSFVGCGSGEKDYSETDENISAEAVDKTAENTNVTETAKSNEDSGKSSEDTEEVVELPNIESQVIYDSDGVKITAKDIEYGGWLGPEMSMLFENSMDKDIMVQAEYVAINGIMVDPMLSCDVASGKKANDTMTFSLDDLESYGIRGIQEIEIVLNIIDADSYSNIAKSEIITLKTNIDESYIQEYYDEGAVAFEEMGIKVVIKKVSDIDSFWGSDVLVYIENNSEENVTIQTRDVSINGYMVDPIFSAQVASGKKAYDSITFFDSDLEENGIEDIEDLELYFHVYDSDEWGTLFESDIVSIRFNNN